MIITKSFLHNITVDEPTHVKQFANMFIGLDHSKARNKLSKHMEELETDLRKRNEYVPFSRKLSGNIDYGFKIGETAQYWYSPHTQRVGEILNINGGRARFSDIIVPLNLVEKYEKVPEQMELF